MYIALDATGQYEHINDFHDEIDLSNLPKPDFMPTKLVRVSDMAVVNRSDVNEGYCALSYSWNQSGEILYDEATGKSKRIDEGKHMITSFKNNMFPDIIINCHKAHENDKLYKIYKVLNIMEENKYYFTKTTKYVKFEGIIQHICQQLHIKYIWYDQMCINQDDKEEKHREIRNMHHIYSNAYCTVAFVPDYERGNAPLGTSEEEYFKRLWTLEEAVKSERLLYVGSYVRKWAEDISYDYGNTKILNKPLSELNVAQILHHAHRRTSTKEHDRVFALIHLFPKFMEYINIDYDQPLEDLMIRFYGLLAKKDLSILLFGEYSYYNSTIQKYKFLPSWTGVNGKHITDDVTTSFRNYDIIGKTMQITSKFVTNGQVIDNDALTIRKEDLPPPPPADINYGDNENRYHLCTSVQLPGTSETRNVSLFYTFYVTLVVEDYLDRFSKELKQLSRFVETKKENMYWCHDDREEYQKVIYNNFDDLTEDVDNLSTQYFILSEVLFKNDYHYYYPIIKKNHGEEFYKAIGCFKICSNEDVFSDCNLPKQTFSIQ